MIVQPKTAYFRAPPETIKIVPSDWPDELFIECAVTEPPSMAGRTAYLRVPAVQIQALLKATRTTAIQARSRTMADARQPSRTTGTDQP